MKTLCVIGDSHVGAVVREWNRLPDSGKPARLVFFAAHEAKWTGLLLDGPVLRAGNAELAQNLVRTSGGLSVIDPEAYDAFLIVGLLFGVVQVLQMSIRFGYDLLPHRESARFRISTPCFAAAAHGRLAESRGMGIARMIRRISDKPIVLSPMPLPGEQLTADIALAPYTVFPIVASNGNGAELMRMFAEVCAGLAAADGLTILRQPEDTIVKDIFSLERYSVLFARGGDAALGENRLAQVVHANEDFGALVLRSCLSVLDLGESGTSSEQSMATAEWCDPE